MADNSAAHARVRAVVAALQGLETAPKDIAPEVARQFDSELRAQIARAEDPSGKAWAPKKSGAGKPLATAGKALKVTVDGAKITATLTGHIAKHHFGAVKGGVKRQILPSKRLPQTIVKALWVIYERHISAKLGLK